MSAYRHLPKLRYCRSMSQAGTLAPSTAVQHSRRLHDDKRTCRTQRNLRSCASWRAIRVWSFKPLRLGQCSRQATTIASSGTAVSSAFHCQRAEPAAGGGRVHRAGHTRAGNNINPPAAEPDIMLGPRGSCHEHDIKRLSGSGALAMYRVLHFAIKAGDEPGRLPGDRQIMEYEHGAKI